MRIRELEPYSAAPFLGLVPACHAAGFLKKVPACVGNKRVSDCALIRHNQFLVALDMTYRVLQRQLRPAAEWMATRDATFMAYLAFLPRSEGNFERLDSYLQGWLNGTRGLPCGTASRPLRRPRD